MNGEHIVVIEDERTIAEAVAARLRVEGFHVDVAADGPSGVELCRSSEPDLVVLDVMLPGLDGLEVCRRIQRDRRVPVVMLTARDDETDVLIGLEVGADDYVTKPFSPRELVARIRAVLRRIERYPQAGSGVLTVGPVTIDPSRRVVRRDGEEVHLTRTEFDLLERLAARADRVHGREELLRTVWGYREAAGVRTVDSHVASLRRKLGDDVVRTVHGVGYAAGVER